MFTMTSEPHETYSFGEVVIAPFPFTDQTAIKRRPAVVVSSTEYHLLRPDLVMMPITSQLRVTATFAEFWISEWKAANHLKPSAIKPQITTMEQKLVIKRLGHLQPADIALLRAAIQAILG
jgi:mRNA interferase MazF